MAKLNLENVTRIFGKEVVAVKDLTMEVADKSNVALLGPSGCGKTTILRIISGLDKPTEGRVLIDNEDVTDKPAMERDVGMVFQFAVIYDSMNVFSNIAIPLKSRKYPKNEIEKRVKRVAKLLRLEPYLDRSPKDLNVSLRQRVAIARAISKPRSLYLLDEPLSNLELKDRIELRLELKRFARDLGQTIIYVTHDQSEAMTIADKIIVMDKGEMQQYDTAENIYSNPANKFVGWFIGTPGMNFVDCKFVEKDDRAYLDAGFFSFETSEDISEILKNNEITDLTLGIRGEDIQIGKRDKNCLEAEISTTETWGNRILVNLKAGEWNLNAKFPIGLDFAAGQRIWIYLPSEKIRIFDRKTEQSIT